jgi:hypothetical protein
MSMKAKTKVVDLLVECRLHGDHEAIAAFEELVRNAVFEAKFKMTTSKRFSPKRRSRLLGVVSCAER